MPHQRWIRILPVATIMYAIAFINRTNISLALPSMSKALHMDSLQAGSIARVLFSPSVLLLALVKLLMLSGQLGYHAPLGLHWNIARLRGSAADVGGGLPSPRSFQVDPQRVGQALPLLNRKILEPIFL